MVKFLYILYQEFISRFNSMAVIETIIKISKKKILDNYLMISNLCTRRWLIALRRYVGCLR